MAEKRKECTGSAKATSRQKAVVEKVLATATRLFAERGYAGTSMRDLSEATGIAPAVIYHHFGSKDSLFAEICDKKYNGFLLAVAQSRQRLGQAKCAPEELASIFFDVLTRDPDLFFLLQRDMINPGPSSDAFKARRHYWRLRELIDATLGLDPDDDRHAGFSFAFSSLIEGACVLTLATNQFEGEQREQYRLTHRHLLRQFVAQAFASLASRPSAPAERTES